MLNKKFLKFISSYISEKIKDQKLKKIFIQKQFIPFNLPYILPHVT